MNMFTKQSIFRSIAKGILAVIVVCSVLGTGADIASAATAQTFTYQPLAPLPGTTITTIQNGIPVQKVTSFSQYASGMFSFGIGIAAILAVVMLVVAGTEYIGGAASDAAHSDAKERAWVAIIGLLIALGGWLILHQINPNILNLHFAPTVVSPTLSPVALYPAPQPGDLGYVTPGNWYFYDNNGVLHAASTQKGWTSQSACITAQNNVPSSSTCQKYATVFCYQVDVSGVITPKCSNTPAECAASCVTQATLTVVNGDCSCPPHSTTN